MKMKKLASISNHLRKYLLLYVFLAIVTGLPIGYYYSDFFKSNGGLVKSAILVLAIATLFPSMIQLKVEGIGREFRLKWKETITALTIVFLIMPTIAILFATCINDKIIGIGYIAANSVPASSASVAYVMLAEGNIEFATVLVIMSVVIALIAAPTYVSIYAQSMNINLPIGLLAESVTLALLTPLALGQLIRYIFVVRKVRKLTEIKMGRGEKTAENDNEVGGLYLVNEASVESMENKVMSRIKPLLSTWTMVFMLALVSLLIASKAELLVSKPDLVMFIISAQLAMYAITTVFIIVISKLLKISYRDHVAIAFISLTKNQSVAAAMAVMAIGPTAAIPAALIPAIQPIIAVIYISLSSTIRRIIPDRGDRPWLKTGML